ncbi:hypothetical protein RvY_03386 [Ramazzottius varieornatus]|uniref:Uncharacterized protein n=1 Tax=Ramazzottius varieornatus TaxID=947166 RepID=A0A1D1UY47_RAMVA|nr:hypothetical protein RvY_03386 [Ramazzottius varieornatus]
MVCTMVCIGRQPWRYVLFWKGSLHLWIIFIILLVHSAAVFIGAQDIGVVRCYVCKSNVFANVPVKDYANCPDLYNSSTTTIKYCRACYKYTGSLVVRYNQSINGVVSRGCFDENAYSTDPAVRGIFQTSGLLEPTAGSGDYAIKENMAVSGKVSGIRGGFLSYGPGELFVCNDRDVCNDSSKISLTFTALPASTILILLCLCSYISL